MVRLFYRFKLLSSIFIKFQEVRLTFSSLYSQGHTLQMEISLVQVDVSQKDNFSILKFLFACNFIKIISLKYPYARDLFGGCKFYSFRLEVNLGYKSQLLPEMHDFFPTRYSLFRGRNQQKSLLSVVVSMTLAIIFFFLSDKH